MSIPSSLLIKGIDDYKTTLSKVSLDTFYQVHFDFGSEWWSSYPGSNKRSGGYDPKEKMSILCSEADLPGPSFSLKSVTGHRQGIVEQFPTLKSYPNVNFAFYVDSDHEILDIFESWMRYISPVMRTSQVTNQSSKIGHQRLRYPDSYKEKIQVTKFERDTLTHKNGSMMVRRDQPSPTFTYDFVNIWPVNLNAMKVSYGESDVLKCFIEFAYDRYFVKDSGMGTVNAISQSDSAVTGQAGRDTPWMTRDWVKNTKVNNSDLRRNRSSGTTGSNTLHGSTGANELSGTMSSFA